MPIAVHVDPEARRAIAAANAKPLEGGRKIKRSATFYYPPFDRRCNNANTTTSHYAPELAFREHHTVLQ